MKSNLKLKNVLLFSVVVLYMATVLSSCSKTVKLEKRLDGKWNIATWKVTEYVNGAHDPAGDENKTNYGEMSFIRDKDGNTGSITITDGGNTFTLPVTSWTNTDEQVTMVVTVLTTTDTWVWTVETNEKDEQFWTMTDTYTDMGDNYKDDYEIKLTRK